MRFPGRGGDGRFRELSELATIDEGLQNVLCAGRRLTHMCGR